MTTPAREQQLEQWLRRQQAPDDASAPTDACVDAETAAAWVDGALPPAQITPLQAHVAGCARCQSLMRTLVDLPEEPLQTRPAQPAHAWWRTWLTWAAPLGAAAVAVLALAVWLRVPTPAEQATLERREPSTAEAPQQATAGRDTATGAVAGGPGSAPLAAPGNDAQANARSAGPPVVELRPQRAQLAEATTAPEAMPAAKTAEAVASVAAADTMNRASSADAVRDDARPAPAPPPAAARAVAPASAVLGLSAESSRTFTLTARTGAARWRVSGSRVERSTDGGQTWTTAALPGTFALTAGAAVSPTTCWLVGASGVVLVTTDGTAWRRAAFVESVDLTAVQAADAASATVEASDGRRFLTKDGGQTWERQ